MDVEMIMLLKMFLGSDRRMYEKYFRVVDAYYECVATRSHNNWRPEGRKQNYPALPIPVLPETTPGEIII